MIDKNFGVEVTFSDLQEINPLISKGVVNICFPTENTNRFIFSKEVINDMIPTMLGQPILAFFTRDKNGKLVIMGHTEDMVSVDGVKTETPEVVPYGFIDYTTEPWWESKTIENGETKEFVNANVYLWTGRYPYLKEFKEARNSMEVRLVDAEYTDDKRIKVNKALFLGTCMIGIKEAFTGSRVKLFSDKNEDYIESLFSNMKEEIKTLFSELKDFDNNANNTNNTSNFLSKDEMGKGETIKVKLTKESAMDSSWSDVDKTSLKNEILKAKNCKSLVKKAYLTAENEWEDKPNECLKYPICVINNNELVYHVGGVQSALSFLKKAKNESYYSSALSKLKTIYKKLGLNTDSFSEINVIENNKNNEPKGDVQMQKEKLTAKMKEMKKCMKDGCANSYASYEDDAMYAMDETKGYAMDDEGIYSIAYKCVKMDDSEDEDLETEDEMQCHPCCPSEMRKCMSSCHSKSKQDMSDLNEKYSKEVGELNSKIEEFTKDLEGLNQIVVDKSKEIEDFKANNTDELLKERDKEITDNAKKFLDLQAEYETYKAESESKLSILDELKEFKKERENEKKFSDMEDILKQNNKYLSDEEYKSFSEKFSEYTTVDSLEVEVNKTIANKVRTSTLGTENFNKMFVETNENKKPIIEENDNSWTSFCKKYNNK